MQKCTLPLVMAVSLLAGGLKASPGQFPNEKASQKQLASHPKALPGDSTKESWKTGGNLGITANQAGYDYWQAGGINSFSANGLFDVFAHYDGKEWSWKNRLTLGYGVSFQDTLFTKTDDQILLESRVDRQLNENWGFSGLLNFRTQFAPGFKSPGVTADSLKISGFMAPAYLVGGLGFTYKPHERFNLFLSPATTKMTFLLDDRLASQGAFGVDSNANLRTEIGGYINLLYKQKLVKNVRLEARLDLYSNYLENPEFIDINSQILLFLKVNKYISANVTVDLRYDHDILFDTNDDGVADAPRTQFREIIGLGFTYDFGDTLEE